MAQIAEQIGAGILLVGCAGGERKRVGAASDTVQRVIDAVNADVVVVPPKVTA